MKLDVVGQSKNAYNQWKDQWRAHALEHKKLAPFKSFNDFVYVGIGKACLLVGNGYSFEEHIGIIKKYKNNVDIMCCDKTLGHLIKNGIKPDYCLVADANVDYEKYLKPYENELENTVMFAAITANPQWSFNGNWKDKYYYCVEDAIQTEKEFTQLSGCMNTIPAATNVGNSMVVLLTQCKNGLAQNFFGYDKYILIGYDFSWQHGKNYYAFDTDAGGKRYYMKHVFMENRGSESCYTSNNLLFSAKWLENYLKLFRLPVVLGSERTILGVIPIKDLESQVQYSFESRDAKIVKDLSVQLGRRRIEVLGLENQLKQISTKHWHAFMQSV